MILHISVCCLSFCKNSIIRNQIISESTSTTAYIVSDTNVITSIAVISITTAALSSPCGVKKGFDYDIFFLQLLYGIDT